MIGILPYGHDDEVTRRFPAVTFGIVIVNVVFFAVIHTRIQRAAKRVDELKKELMRPGTGRFFEEMQPPTPFDPTIFVDPTPKEVQKKIRAEEPGEFIMQFRHGREGLERRSQEDIDRDTARWKERTAKAEEYASAYDIKHEGGAYRGLAQQGGRDAAGGRNFRIWMPLTSMFVHFGWSHLIGNFLFLLIAGTKIEDVWGRRNFGILYLIGGLVANFAHVLSSRQPEIMFGGASGAIAALMGTFLIFCFDARIKFVWYIFFFGLLRTGTFLLPAYVVFPALVLMDIYMAIQGLTGMAADDVAHWAHIGGFFFGLAVAAAIRQLELERKLFPIVEADALGRVVADSPLSVWKKHELYEEAIGLRARGRLPEAAALFEKMGEDHPDVPGPWEEAADCYRLARDPDRQRTSLLAAVTRALRRKADTEAMLVYRKLQDAFPGILLEPPEQLQVVSLLERKGEHPEAANALRRLLDSGVQGPIAVKALFRYGEICEKRFQQMETALDAYRQALILVNGDPNWAPLLRERMDAVQKARKTASDKAPPPPRPAPPMPPPMDPHLKKGPSI